MKESNTYFDFSGYAEAVTERRMFLNKTASPNRLSGGSTSLNGATWVGSPLPNRKIFQDYATTRNTNSYVFTAQ